MTLTKRACYRRSPHLYGMLLWPGWDANHETRKNVAVLTYMECFSDFLLFSLMFQLGSQSSPIWNASLTPIGNLLDAQSSRSPHLYGMLLWPWKRSRNSSKTSSSQSSPIWNASLTDYRIEFYNRTKGRSPHLYGMLLWQRMLIQEIAKLLSQSSPIWNASLTSSAGTGKTYSCRSPHLYGMLLWRIKKVGTETRVSQSSPIWNASLTM